jgi:hypothetical protein
VSEFTWYSRLLVWVGAVILLVESVTGRTLGLVTVIGVLALGGGLIAFIAGLALDSRPVRLPLVEADSHGALVGEAHVTEAPPSAWIPPEPVAKTEVPPEPKSETPPPVLEARERRGAIGIDVTADSRASGAVCPSCQQPLRPGEVAAECQQCHTLQHAACWIGNRFQCARDGCGGQGPLEAPDSPEESRGPSTA